MREKKLSLDQHILRYPLSDIQDWLNIQQEDIVATLNKAKNLINKTPEFSKKNLSCTTGYSLNQ